ncbi:hypothetical protein RIF29_21183 [Crotalaria pallida]|uniref:Uncharacterized protein n=1 Tax=Crotalaria pallida TaxID=3830 RepID=A0AAN9F2K1_CROPI
MTIEAVAVDGQMAAMAEDLTKHGYGARNKSHWSKCEVASECGDCTIPPILRVARRSHRAGDESRFYRDRRTPWRF